MIGALGLVDGVAGRVSHTFLNKALKPLVEKVGCVMLDVEGVCLKWKGVSSEKWKGCASGVKWKGCVSREKWTVCVTSGHE